MSRLLGIDCSPSAVRTALVRTSYRRVTIEALGEAPVTPVDGGEAAAIRHAVGALKPDGVAISLRGDKCFFRRLDLPAAAQKELGSVLGFELESTVPFDMDGAVFDYRTLSHEKTLNQLKVFAAIARIEDVSERIDTVRTATGREPELVSPGAMSLANLSMLMPDLVPAAATKDAIPEPIAILELNEITAEIVILLSGEPVFARTLSRGTRGLPGTAPALARELRQTFAAWRAAGGDPVPKMYLVGGGASVQGAELYLSTEVGLSIVPLPEPNIAELSSEHRDKLPSFAKALGLAMSLEAKSKAFNLRQGDLEAARSYPFLREKIPLLSGLAAVIAVSFGFSIIAEMRSLGAEQAALTQRLQTVTGEVFGEPIEDPADVAEMLKNGPNSETEDPMPKVDAFDVMVQLSKAVPQDVLHDVAEFDVSSSASGATHATIQGTVPIEQDAQKTAEAISKVMKQQECFKDVKVAGTTQFNKERQKYTLEFDLRCGEKKKKGAKKSGESEQ